MASGEENERGGDDHHRDYEDGVVGVVVGYVVVENL